MADLYRVVRQETDERGRPNGVMRTLKSGLDYVHALEPEI